MERALELRPTLISRSMDTRPHLILDAAVVGTIDPDFGDIYGLMGNLLCVLFLVGRCSLLEIGSREHDISRMRKIRHVCT